MGWESLFADLEGEFDAAEAAQQAAEIEDRTRHEHARIRLVDRLRAALGTPVTITLARIGPLRGVVTDVGADWLLLTEPSRQALVPLSSILAIGGLSGAVSAPGSEGAVGSRLRLGYTIRALARDRAAVEITLLDGSGRHGTIDRVGADHLTLALHAADEARRRNAVRELQIVPFLAVIAVRSA